jgi:hypothetical protein
MLLVHGTNATRIRWAPGVDVMAPATLASLKSTTDPETILEAFYLNALQLPKAAVDGLKGTEIWQARLTAALTITREIDAVNEFRATDRLANIAAQLPDARVVAVQGQAHQAIDLDVDQFVGLVFDFDTTTDGPRAPG